MEWEFNKERQMLRAQLYKRWYQIKRSKQDHFVDIGRIVKWFEERKKQEQEEWFSFLDQTRSTEEKFWNQISGIDKRIEITVELKEKESGKSEENGENNKNCENW